MRRFLALSGNDESARHASSRSRLLWGRHRNNSVYPCVEEEKRLDIAAWFLINFLTISFIEAE
jgi:hypothetical protein